jgi:sugar phosphate isomerase/epimerase
MAATTTAAAAAAVGAAPKGSTMKGPLVCVFSKHLQFLDCKALAKTCKALGVDGVDLTVREGGHVTPGQVATGLPRAVEAIRAEGLEVAMISTQLYSGADPDARPILQAASNAGIPYFRIGGQRYDTAGNPLEQLKGFTEEVRSLAKLAEEFRITAGYHNHSGYHNVGAAVWDLQRMIEAVGSERLGSNFDIGHAAVEGAFGVWQINARLIAPHVKMMAVKDFIWNKATPQWVPLGEGLVQTAEFLKIAKQTGFAGPISLHFEYKTSSPDALLEEIRKAAATLRAEMKKAGYA